MATYRVTFEEESHFVECDSMDEAKREAARLVNDPDMDWRAEEKDGSIGYYDYFVDVIIEKYDDDADDEEEEERQVQMRLVHETKSPGECPFCGSDDWSESKMVYMLDSSYYRYESTCRQCGAIEEITLYAYARWKNESDIHRKRWYRKRRT